MKRINVMACSALFTAIWGGNAVPTKGFCLIDAGGTSAYFFFSLYVIPKAAKQYRGFRESKHEKGRTRGSPLL